VLNVKVLTSANLETYYAEAVVSGIEDYYLGADAPAGVWCASASFLGLSGSVARADLTAVLDDRHPHSGLRLGLADNRRVRGFDLTFRAPKSVSVAWAFASPDVACDIAAAHTAAVAGAVAFLERQACAVRRGHNGFETADGSGFVAAAFAHRTSRAGDPLLHTHVVVANSTPTADDGLWRTLDSRRIFAHAKTAGYLYQAQLRHELAKRFGAEWSPVENGVGELTSVTEPVRRLFSKRRTAIIEELVRAGRRSARAAQVATLATRPAKIVGERDDELRGRWCAEASAAGIPINELVGGLTNTPTKEPTSRSDPSVESLGVTLCAPTSGLTAKRSTFSRLELIQGICDQLPNGAALPRIERLADELEIDPRFVALGPSRRPGVPGEIYTTRELLDIEEHVLACACAKAAPGRHTFAVTESDLRRVLRGVPRSLSSEQRALVGALARSTRGIELVVAAAGTGKTTSLAAAVAAWRTTHMPIIGAALAGRAVDELATAAKIPAFTIASLLGALDRGERLDVGTIMVVDEAAMVGTRQLAALARYVWEVHGKLVLVGDPHQLPAIDAGGLFAGLARRLPIIELVENRRQQMAWERIALTELRTGDPQRALATYVEHGRVHLAPTREQLLDRLVDDWWENRCDGGESIMIAARRDDVRDLNQLARQRLESSGRLTGSVLMAGGRYYQAGDEIICLRNSRKLGVRNGTRGVVTSVGATLDITTTDGAHRRLPLSYVDEESVDLGYAFTIHKTQGMTAGHVHALVDDTVYRELAYTGLSRGKTSNHLYVMPDSELGSQLASIERGLTRIGAEELAVDTPPRRFRRQELSV
jgi:conjugative relaxase-like TrwC/TraI family protein